MKKNDIAAIILIASVSAIIAWFSANAVLGSPKQNTRSVEVAEAIDPEVNSPDKRIFNSEAINPTVERTIGKSANSLPFR